MAKQKAKRPETKTVTLSTGTTVTGAVELIDKMVKGDRGGKAAKRTPATKPTPEPEPAPEQEQEPEQEPSNAERPSRGASLAAWADFAKSVGFVHPEGATRDEIRDAYEAEHPSE